ncbi:uncharacterized protein LY79DRAFT_269876 [Colletotrichum navitas]|uniref:Uncharacterized protein n=1 Tax=Colletotrichum navitas TaxID=681940 RepID=A0AAD8PV78_9PEZI|nr:uncharacterized protein LY79DRAFT_269876 [Colletotrichum navitas]KAK1585317.1 hypothetical protein LY79DRAFT_269876 [Colletotrichum navitas]
MASKMKRIVRQLVSLDSKQVARCVITGGEVSTRRPFSGIDGRQCRRADKLVDDGDQRCGGGLGRDRPGRKEKKETGNGRVEEDGTFWFEWQAGVWENRLGWDVVVVVVVVVVVHGVVSPQNVVECRHCKRRSSERRRESDALLLLLLLLPSMHRQHRGRSHDCGQTSPRPCLSPAWRGSNTAVSDGITDRQEQSLGFPLSLPIWPFQLAD